MRGIHDIFRLTDDAARVAALAPMLAVEPRPAPAVEAPPAEDAAERECFVADGYAILAGAAPTELASRLADGVGSIVAAGLPAVLVYAFAEAWIVGEAVRARASALLGAPYALVEDLWAWRIPRGSGRGWPPHRGVTAPLLDRSAPELVNTWVALSDAAADRACMHLVPLGEDPGYPDALERCDAPLEAVRALPVTAGTALAWNANVLHWGGACAARAAGPRVSCSFTLVRGGTPHEESWPTVRTMPDFTARMGVIAHQIVTYGEGQPDVGPDVLAWARARATLDARAP